jgi:hypothetical protein
VAGVFEVTASLMVISFIFGAVLLVRGLSNVSRARGDWTRRTIAGTAKIISWERVEVGEGIRFAIVIEYVDVHGQTQQISGPDLSWQPETGQRVNIRYDPNHPSSAKLDHDFAGVLTGKFLIVTGGALMLVAFGFSMAR